MYSKTARSTVEVNVAIATETSESAKRAKPNAQQRWSGGEVRFEYVDCRGYKSTSTCTLRTAPMSTLGGGNRMENIYYKFNTFEFKMYKIPCIWKLPKCILFYLIKRPIMTPRKILRLDLHQYATYILSEQPFHSTSPHIGVSKFPACSIYAAICTQQSILVC